MDRDSARKAAEVMLAYADGLQLQYRKFWIGKDGSRNYTDEWYELSDKDDINFDWLSEDYRIKPTPFYRPFANAEECWEEMQKHEPFGWLKDKEDGTYLSIKALRGSSIIIQCDRSLKARFESYTFADGSVFGKLTKEE